MTILAQAETVVETVSTEIIKTFGVPGAVLIVLAYTVRKVVIWAMPHVESMVAAYNSRQRTTEECQKRLTDASINIQTQTLDLVKSIRSDFKPPICRHPNSVSSQSAA